MDLFNTPGEFDRESDFNLENELENLEREKAQKKAQQKC